MFRADPAEIRVLVQANLPNMKVTEQNRSYPVWDHSAEDTHIDLSRVQALLLSWPFPPGIEDFK